MNHTVYTCCTGSSLSFRAMREIFAFRYLLYVFLRRDLKIRYRYTILGGIWCILQPLSMMVVFSIVFSRIFHVETGGIPYPLFSYSALIIWQSVSRIIIQGGECLSQCAAMVSKIYFPRILIPLSVVLGVCVDFFISFLILLFMIFAYGKALTAQAIWAPLILMLCIIVSTGVIFWLSALDAQFRDIRTVLPFLMQIWMFSTPIMYPMSIIPEHWQWLYQLNPFVAPIELFRWSLLGHSFPNFSCILSSLIISLLLFISGFIYFHKVEGTLVDTI